MKSLKNQTLRLFFLMLILLLCGVGARAETANLREYGQVTATFGPNRAEFVCEDADKADLLLGKLLADLFWDAGDAHTQKTVSVGGASVVVHSDGPYGVAVAGRSGRHVVIVGADAEAQILDAVAKEPLLTGPGVQFAAVKPYPLALDFYDLRAFRSYIATPMGSSQGFGLGSHWPFLKKFGMNALAFQQPSFNFFNPAPGVVDWAAPDYEVREAERQGGLIIPSFGAGGVGPLWFYNKYPGSRTQPSPTTLMGHWGRVGGAGDYFESWYTPASQRAEGDFAFERQVMERYGRSPAVGGWQIYAGQPGAEMGNHGLSTEFFDYSPAGEAGFRNWLRATRGDSLAALGQRWFGDPKHYQAWDEVTVPDINSFFGDMNAASLRLNHGWERRPAGEREEDPPAEDAGWVPVAAPPSQQQTFLPWQPAWYRCVFQPSDWKGRAPGQEAYLVCNTNERSQAGLSVWLNGNYLGVYKPESGSVGFKVTHLLQDGPNVLLLKLPADGKLIGPVFLSHTPPRYFPYLGRGRNAQYADLKDWQIYGIYSYHRGSFEEARRLDPERPMLLATDDLGSMGDYAAALASDLGMGIENTGREAFYFPWWPGLGYVNGFYATSEPSGVPLGSSLDRMTSWMLLDGDSAHQLFWDIENFQQREKEDGWFTRNTRRIQLFGKSLREKPSVALLWSVRTNLLGNPLPWNWDIGRGELESAHFDNVYVTEREIQKGLASDYPVVFDGGTALMDPSLSASIRKYVEAGGTYVALHNTGHYTTLDPDSYPISDLTGFKIVSASKRGKITFGTNLPLFHAWEGKQFEGEGTSLDWKNNQTAKGVGLALSPASSDTVALARWDDGSVAVGYRKLGKGRVIVLGSTFWRSGKDTAGVWLSGSEVERHFFETLFGELGVKRTADSDSPDIWARKFITKNGLQDWLISYNSADVPRTATLALRVEGRPTQVLDMLTNQPVPFTYSDDGWVHLPGITVPVAGTRIFGVRRANLASGVPFWWGEKTKYWKRIALPPAPAAEKDAAGGGPETISFDRWHFLADRDNSVSAGDAWKQLGFAEARWQTLPRGPWNLQGDTLKDYRGVGLYRAAFHVPAGWTGHRIILGLYSFNNPIVYDKGEFFVNGKPVASYEARGWNQTFGYDITDALKPGDNVLAVKVTSGKEFAGLSGPIWIAPERILSPSLSLNGPWQAVGAEGKVKSEVSAPCDVTARNIVQQVTVPASWQGKDVYLHIETPDQCLAAIVVNGHPMVYTSFQHHFGTRTDINVSLYLRAGQPNRIELWPYGTLPQGDGSVKPAEDGLRLTTVRLGCEQGRANPLFGSMIHPEDPVDPDPPVVLPVQAAAVVSAANLAANADFETWDSPAIPAHWEVSDTPVDPKDPKQGTVAKDAAVTHGGGAAVHIENGLPTDVTQVSQMIPIEPNASYRVRGWVKGENIASNSGDGVLIWTSPGPAQDYYAHASYTAQAPKTRTGTFDWQPFEFTINTGPDAALLKLDLQLRRASGKVWFDDVEVLKKGAVTPVETY